MPSVRPARASRPPPTAAGQLAERPFAHLLAYALDRKLTGSFELVDLSRDWLVLYVDDGLVSRVATSETVSHAVQTLHERSRMLHHGFGLSPDTTFAFYVGTDLVGARPGDAAPVTPYAAIWRGVVAHPSWGHVRAALATVGDRRLRVVGPLDLAGLSDAELAATEGMRTTPSTVADIAARANLGGLPGELLAYFLLITKLASIEGGSLPVSSPPAPVSGPAPALTAAPDSAGPTSMSFSPLRSGRPKARVSTDVTNLIEDFPRRFATPAPTPVPPRPVSTLPPVSMPGSLASPGPLRAPGPIESVPSAAPPRSSSSSPAAQRLTDAEGSLARAEMHVVLGERDEALGLVKKALAQAPGMPSAVVFLAYLEALASPPGQEEALRGALRGCDAALRQQPTCRRGHFYRAEVRRRLGDQAGAVEDLRAAVEADPGDGDAVRELRRLEKQPPETRRPSGAFGRQRQE